MISLSGLTTIDVQDDVFRNIISLRKSQDLFDDLSNDPSAWATAQALEHAHKPMPYSSSMPIIDRPFEDAVWAEIIEYPFSHAGASRFSDGSFGVWYGCADLVTSIHETAHHWIHGFLADADFLNESVEIERKVSLVRCEAALLDLRLEVKRWPQLMLPSDYSFCQTLGKRLSASRHPGLVSRSVRDPRGEGTNYAVLQPAVLSQARDFCYLRFAYADGIFQAFRTEVTSPLVHFSVH